MTRGTAPKGQCGGSKYERASSSFVPQRELSSCPPERTHGAAIEQIIFCVGVITPRARGATLFCVCQSVKNGPAGHYTLPMAHV